MYVCSCRRVTDRAICAAIASGACDENSVARECGAGTVCGGCRPTIKSLIEQMAGMVLRQALPAVSTRMPNDAALALTREAAESGSWLPRSGG